MNNFFPLKISIKKEFRGLIPDVAFDFTDTLFLLDDNGKGKSTLLKGIIAANNSDDNINNQTPKDIIDLPISGVLKIGYFGQDSNMKTLGYMVDEDFDLSISSLKSSSGEGVFQQVINVIKNNNVILLDEPSTSLSIRNIRRLAYLIKKVSESASKTFIISDHNETFLKLFKEENAYRVNGEKITVKEYLKEQYLAEI